MTKALVTGASGFIGLHLVEALVARGDKVTCLVRQASQTHSLKRLGLDLVYGDVTDPHTLLAAVAGQDIVYHLAGLTLALNSRSFYRVNQFGFHNIAQVCARQANPPVLILVSSLAAAGPSLDGRPKSESDPARPVSHYGRSKRYGELQAELFADRVPITIVRPPIVLGQGDRLGLPMFQAIDKTGLHIVPGLGRHRYSLIHADDLAELMLLAAERGQRLPAPASSQAQSGQGYYFAACEEDLAYDDLGRLIGKALGRGKVFPMHIATPLVWMVSGLVETISQIIRQPRYLHIDKAREITAGSWTCSPRRARDELGFQVKAPLSERLRQTALWYRKEGWL
jgi:nucleoside-diphosphate-sugar epimerase